MKKIIQIVSFLALVFVMAGADVNAQSNTKIDASIPYDFMIGDQEFEAGKYVLRVRQSGAASVAELRDSRHRVVYEAFVLENGENGNGKANLVFDRSGSTAKLTQIRTGSKGFALNEATQTDRSVNLASKKKKSREVSVKN